MASKNVALPVEQDRLNRKQLRSKYNVTRRQIAAVPGLFGLFQRAFQGQWDQDRFNSELEQLDWYRQNAASVREYMLLEAEGGADFGEKVQDSHEYVRQTAMQMGVNLSNEQLDDLAHQNLMFGWGSQGQNYELKQKIAEMPHEGMYGGDIRKNADSLFALAHANGMKYDGGWFMAAGKSIAAGLSNPEDWESEIRDGAAQRFPVYGDKILSGMNVTDLVAPYRSLMSQEWDLDPTSINLDDPTLLSAFGMDDKGNPGSMNLGDFQRKLRNDPRWLDTDNAQNKITSIASGVMQMFGLRG